MFRFVRFINVLSESSSKTSPKQNPCLKFVRFCHFDVRPTRLSCGNVAVFWDLDNKPPNTIPPYDAAIKLKKAASSFGVVRSMVAYANHHAFEYVPVVVREKRRERRYLNELESRGVIKSVVPYKCSVCGRKFSTNDKLVEHFKQLHEREQKKRLSRLDSVRGNKRVKLAGKLSMKIEKYKNAAPSVLVPKVGYGLASELKRAGFWVRLVSDKPQAADIALRNHMVEMMDQRQVQCLVLVSDDSDFLGVLKEAKMRCLKTVVVGDTNDGSLKRCADASFSWKEVIVGKAKTQAVSVLGGWRDRDVLKRLEWSYKPKLEKTEVDFVCSASESEDEDLARKDDVEPWWKIDSDADDIPPKSFK